ncbi:hypothetical protein LX64_03848 [Chitinophaga skermanii]|uniref:Uncharacterized protein n=1 Tax=Chitinophaga skermanii TaxID=331697 RepID=A0A327QBH1_9BACT|nr:hypothetical protein [Chitinophaga skermanii]RAJ01631.1 hypothetical protein LX64_03848 [Chitinophaga skermanii]
MAWTATNFPKEMNGLTPDQREKAIDIANQFLAREGNEPQAIEHALKMVERWTQHREHDIHDIKGKRVSHG